MEGEKAGKVYPIRCSGCLNLASTLRCPTCVKIGIPGSYWCNQDCFKANWGEHKNIHAMYVALESDPNTYIDKRFIGYGYTGRLRKGKEGPKRLVPPEIRRPVYVNHPEGIDPRERDVKRERIIEQHSPAKVATARAICAKGREVLEEAQRAVRVGVTTDELDRVVHEACLERGLYPSPLGYGHFPKSCCTSVNEVVCHGIPDSTELKDGDIVNVDVSVYGPDGFHADLNETYPVGQVDARGKELIKTTYECMWKAIVACKPGMYYRDVGDIITRHAKSKGFSVIKTYCGHGVGELFHSSPTVPHYANNKAVGVMKPGHIFTIEPMINEGEYRETRWPDDWTSATYDGKRSAQFEETIVITETGVEVLTKGKYVPEGAEVFNVKG